MKPKSEIQEKKQPKTIWLKQFFIVAKRDGEKPRKAAFILHTCAVNARKEFEHKTGLTVELCQQTAESEFMKEDLKKYDFWKENRNWETTIETSGKLSKSAENYFKMKSLAEKVQAAKTKLMITDWENATEEQLKKLDEILGK